MYCAQCGKQIDDKSAFCPYCGAKTGKPSTTANQQANTASTAPAAPQSPPRPTPVVPNGAVNTPATQPPKKKKFPTWAIVLIIVGIILAIITTVTVILVKKVVNSVVEYGSEVVSELEDFSTTAPPFEDTTADEAPTATEPDTTEQTGTANERKSTIDVSKVGKPTITDFTWVKNAPRPTAEQLFTNPLDISGKWKAYYVYSDGVKELCNITVAATKDTVKVAVKPWFINYEGKWENEGDVQGYLYDTNGRLINGTISVAGKYGTIVLYSFCEVNGKQYGYGKTVTQSGETVNIALVRP